MTFDQIQPGMQVRVIGNRLNGRQPDSEQLLQVGQLIRLTGQYHTGAGTVYYDRGLFPRHNIDINDIQLPLEPIDPHAPRSSVDIWQAARNYVRF